MPDNIQAAVTIEDGFIVTRIPVKSLETAAPTTPPDGSKANPFAVGDIVQVDGELFKGKAVVLEAYPNGGYKTKQSSPQYRVRPVGKKTQILLYNGLDIRNGALKFVERPGAAKRINVR